MDRRKRNECGKGGNSKQRVIFKPRHLSVFFFLNFSRSHCGVTGGNHSYSMLTCRTKKNGRRHRQISTSTSTSTCAQRCPVLSYARTFTCQLFFFSVHGLGVQIQLLTLCMLCLLSVLSRHSSLSHIYAHSTYTHSRSYPAHLLFQSFEPTTRHFFFFSPLHSHLTEAPKKNRL